MTAMITKIPQLSLSLQIKMWFMKHIAFSFILIATLFSSCSSNGRSSESRQARLDGRVVTDEGEANTTKSEITAEMAYEGVRDVEE